MSREDRERENHVMDLAMMEVDAYAQGRTLEIKKVSAKARGFEAVCCNECGNFTLIAIASDKKLKCDTCGLTQDPPPDFEWDDKK